MINKKKCLVIGITGASASGKTFIANILYKELSKKIDKKNIVVISEDNYYKDQKKIIKKTLINYDHPSAIDHNFLLKHLRMLKTGLSINMPIYNYINHSRLLKTILIKPKKIVILEGILILTNLFLRKEINFTAFIDTPLDICLIRRIKRDMNHRGRSLDSIIKQYQNTIRPMFFKFIKPSINYSDIVIRQEDNNLVAVNILKKKIIKLILNI